MSKSRNDKKPPAQPPPVPQTNEIIPGKFNENQWNSMLEQENGQEFILDILDEILDCTVQVIHDKYIQSQLEPYSVHAARDLLLQVIELRFLEHDIGEESPQTDFTWLEDEEPLPCMTDSWAQGSVPVQRCQSRSLPAKSETGTATPRSDSSEVLQNKNEVQNEVRNDDGASHERVTSIGEADMSINVVLSPPPTSRVTSPGRRNQVVKSTAKKTKQSNRKTTEPVKQRESQRTVKKDVDLTQTPSAKPIHQIRTGRAPGEQEVTYDEHGNVVAMMKLSVDKLPTHRIRPRYNILDPQNDNLHTQSSLLRKAAKKEENPPRTGLGHPTDTRKTREKQTFKSLASNTSLEIAQKDSDETIKPLPPPLADCMDISAGVVVREGQLVRKGPDLFSAGHPRSQTEILNLQPVDSLAKRQAQISVSDVIGNTSPIIRQMRLKPIPPIAHRG